MTMINKQDVKHGRSEMISNIEKAIEAIKMLSKLQKKLEIKNKIISNILDRSYGKKLSRDEILKIIEKTEKG